MKKKKEMLGEGSFRFRAATSKVKKRDLNNYIHWETLQLI